MDSNKALYMANFLKLRDNLGTVEVPTVKYPFDISLYNQIQKKDITDELIDNITEIKSSQDKIIHRLKKEDQALFYPDLPELDTKDDTDVQEVKQIKLNKEDPLIHESKDLKQIIIDPHYNVKNE